MHPFFGFGSHVPLVAYSPVLNLCTQKRHRHREIAHAQVPSNRLPCRVREHARRSVDFEHSREHESQLTSGRVSPPPFLALGPIGTLVVRVGIYTTKYQNCAKTKKSRGFCYFWILPPGHFSPTPWSKYTIYARHAPFAVFGFGIRFTLGFSSSRRCAQMRFSLRRVTFGSSNKPG